MPPSALAQGAEEPPLATAIRSTDDFRLDGVLSEEVWSRAVPIGPLRQREPLQGQAATEDTEVKVIVGDRALFFGVVCRDRSPEEVVSTQLGRDANLEVDDYVTIVIDPFFDHRNGFFFQVNPAGARGDGQISNNSEQLNLQWDGIWNAASRRTDEGWSVEIEIPFKTLRFSAEQAVWGFNVERQIKRKNEIDRWASPRLDAWIGSLERAGRLEGMGGLRQGIGLDLRPYGSGGVESGDGQFAGGVDVFKTLTPSLNASLTVNTDFAETEVDARQVNLTRFPLFFPEKRAFFLEGAGVFDVAGMSASRDVIPFFSRRIGLLSGTDVPIAVGAKIVGRQGPYNIGLLNVQTRDLKDSPLAGQNLLAARVSRNFLRQSWVGAILTHGNPQGNGENTLAGLDMRLSTSSFRGNKNLAFEAYYLHTTDEAEAKSDDAISFKIEYPNDNVTVGANWRQIGDAFQPRLGFVPRRGVRRLNAWMNPRIRPNRWGVRYLLFQVRPEYITNLQNETENWRVILMPLNLRTDSGDGVDWSYTPEFEHLNAPFVISPGVAIPPGSYRWGRSQAQASTATKRAWVADLAWSWGGFYDGKRKQLGVGFTWKPSTHASTGVRVERNDVTLPYGRFSTDILSARGDYNFSPNVSWQNLVQYDTESRLLGAQSRFRWILKPGNDLFLVIDRGWLREPDGAYAPSYDKASAKLQYTIRL